MKTVLLATMVMLAVGFLVVGCVVSIQSPTLRFDSGLEGEASVGSIDVNRCTPTPTATPVPPANP